jgi:hypothetical protein
MLVIAGAEDIGAFGLRDETSELLAMSAGVYTVSASAIAATVTNSGVFDYERNS